MSDVLSKLVELNLGREGRALITVNGFERRRTLVLEAMEDSLTYATYISGGEYVRITTIELILASYVRTVCYIDAKYFNWVEGKDK